MRPIHNQLKILNETRKTTISAHAILADTFLLRIKGLLGRRSLNPGESLIITQCQSIHMLLMRFPIDVIFVDKNDLVVGLVEDINPFRLSPIFWKASFAIEANPGTITMSGTSLGDLVRIARS